METIHLKTADPVSQHLLRLAAQRGLELQWERYERLQPQDGFLRLGLSCPFECMHGPCRIDPFGRGPNAGICGLGRDEMVAAMLLRLCQRGAMEALAALPHSNATGGIDYSDSLGTLITQALSATAQPELSCSEIITTSSTLQRTSCSCEELLRQASRLSLLTLGLVEQNAFQTEAELLPVRSGYGVIPEGRIRIGFCGRPPADLIAGIEQAVRDDKEDTVALLALGEWLMLDDRFMPVATTSGETELLLSSGTIHLLVAGPDTNPGTLQLCGQLNIPVITEGSEADYRDILQRARTSAGQASQPDLFAYIPAGHHYDVVLSEKGIVQMSDGASSERICLVGGSDTPHLPFGQLPAELLAELAAQGRQVACWGDAALWMARQDQLSPGSAPPPLTLDNRQGPLLAVKGLANAGKLENLQGICFTGLKDCLEFNLALGLATLGCRVSIAAPIPIQGSRVVMEALERMLQVNGGQLLCFDHPPACATLSEWFTNPG
jgi:hypothetical protein